MSLVEPILKVLVR